LAVGSQQRNRIDNAMDELLVSWAQDDAGKAVCGRSAPAQTSHDGESIRRAPAHRPHRRSTHPLSVDDDQSPEDDAHIPPQGQSQAIVFGVMAVMKDNDVEKAEGDTMLQPHSRNDESEDDVPSV
jgi:hypothetical protein